MNTEKQSSVWGLLLNNNLSSHGVGGVNALKRTCWHCWSQWSSSCNLHHFLEAASLNRNNGCTEGQRSPTTALVTLRLDPLVVLSITDFVVALGDPHGQRLRPQGDGQVERKPVSVIGVQGPAADRSSGRRWWGTQRLLTSNFMIRGSHEQCSPLWRLCCLMWREHSLLPSPWGILMVSVSSICLLQCTSGSFRALRNPLSHSDCLTCSGTTHTRCDPM